MIARNPFAARRGIEPSKLLVTFLASDPGAEARDKVLKLKTDPEELRIDGRELYIYFPNGMARPKLSWAAIARTLKTPATGRNWNTVTKLLEMAESLEVPNNPLGSRRILRRDMEHKEVAMKPSERWPALPLAEWRDTYATLHMWTQIVGKVRLALSPPINHWWGSTLYVTSRGLTTSPIPCAKGVFEINFDFIAHTLEITTSLGESRAFRLMPRTVAEFYAELMGALHSLGIDVKVWTMPVEVPRPVRFNLDNGHASYDGEYAHRFWQILVSVDTVFREFRSRFIGKVSPVHFFWGSFDLAVTRFSGRRAPERPGADPVTKEAYSHEVISVGFWPGDGEAVKDAAFYAYAAPEPAGFKERRVRPAKAFYSTEKSECFLMYHDVRLSDSPEQSLLDFCQSTYEAAAILGNWDRANLERPALAATNT